MTSVVAYLGLGSSLGDRREHLKAALTGLRSDNLKVVGVSSVYESPHLGLEPGDALRYPSHYNIAAKIETNLEPTALLDLINYVELIGGRQRLNSERWGPRTIDIDILIYGRLVLKTNRLELPHPGLTSRRFVVDPLAELSPYLILQDGRRIGEIALSATIIGQQIERVASADELLL